MEPLDPAKVFGKTDRQNCQRTFNGRIKLTNTEPPPLFLLDKHVFIEIGDKITTGNSDVDRFEITKISNFDQTDTREPVKCDFFTRKK